jgi:regulator of nucleoside diphosphate kinase
MLLSEIGRATIVVQDSLPPQVVAVHSEVEIRDNVTNTKRRLRLVYPEDATLDSNMVSVLTPLGAALVGLSVGDTIDWCTATGDQSSVTVLRTGMNLSLS